LIIISILLKYGAALITNSTKPKRKNVCLGK
jgi:hypothetical protein